MSKEKELLEKFYRISLRSYNMMITLMGFQGYDKKIELGLLDIMTKYKEYIETCKDDKYLH